MTRLLIDERPLMVLPKLAERIGLNEAIALQQLHWMTGRDSALEADGRRWLQMEVDGWLKVFPFWSESTIKRVWKNLDDAKLVARKRGRESNVYSVNYEAVGQIDLSTSSDRPVETGQIDPSPCKREEGKEVEREQQATGTVAGAVEAPPETLFGPAPAPPAPAPPSPTDNGDETAARVREIWTHYVAVFGDRLRIKELTPPRERMLKKGLTAVGDDVKTCKAAIDGLKSYRDKNPHGSSDVSLGVIFETGPKSRSNLTDQIEWWASQEPEGKSGASGNMGRHPSAVRDRVRRHRVQVVEMYQQPDLSGVRERGEAAVAWLRQHANEEPIIEGDPPRVTGWKELEA